MKILSIGFYQQRGDDLDPCLITAVYELKQFSIFFERGLVRDVCTFTMRTLVSRCPPNTLKSVEGVERGERSKDIQGEYICHVNVDGTGLGCALVADKEYPLRVAHGCIKLALETFRQHVDPARYAVLPPKDIALSCPALEEVIRKYQNPMEADKILKLRSDIEDTKTVLLEAIEAVLRRGEKIEDLLDKSRDLNRGSKSFLIKSKKMNSRCCVIL